MGYSAMLKVLQTLYRGLQTRIAFMKTKSLTDYTDFATKLLILVTGLFVTLIILSSPFSESVRGNVMGLAEALLAKGTMGILILLWLVVGGLDGCWQFNYATFKAKGINRQWINLIQIKYPYQKWLKPIYVITGWIIIFNWIF
tara:strand:- start:2251 stop:2679 length:429 start_codon:yes stop_codon:yes gene_type:complete